jgi:opacity protein-like surface antigen
MKAIAVLTLLMLPVHGLAQSGTPKAELFGGFSYVRVDADEGDNRNLYGWNGAVSFSLDKTFGFTIDASGHYQDNAFQKSRSYTILAGPRFTSRNEHSTAFAHILFGGTHDHERFDLLTTRFTTNDNAFAMALGGGVDVNVTPHFGVRVIQADYVLTKFTDARSGKSIQHNARVGIGVVFRFGN